MVPYLIFIVMSKTIDFLNLALVSQNAQSLHNFAFNRPTIKDTLDVRLGVLPVSRFYIRMRNFLASTRARICKELDREMHCFVK